MSNPHHLAVNVLRLLAIIERCPAKYNRNSFPKLREQIDALHRIKLTLALPQGFDLESVDRRVDAVMELEKGSRLAQHQPGEVRAVPFALYPGSPVHLLDSHPPALVSAMQSNNEDGLRLALLTPKGAPSRKKSHAKADGTLKGKSVSMQALHIDSISKMNKQLLNGMQDIRNSAIKVEIPVIVCFFQLREAELNHLTQTQVCIPALHLVSQDNIALSETSKCENEY